MADDKYYKLMTQITSARRDPEKNAEMTRRHAARTGGDGRDWERAALAANGFDSFEQLQEAVYKETGEERRAAYREAGAESEGATSKYLGFMQALGQGATMGLGDELAGLFGGEMAREMSRGQTEEFRAKEPLLSYGGEILGGFAAPGLAPAKAARTGATLTRAALRGVGTGALEGAVAGFAEGEGLAGRFGGAAFGAGVGAGTGGILSSLGYGGRRGYEAFTGGVPGQTTASQARDVAQRVTQPSGRGPDGIVAAHQRAQELVPGTPPAALPELRDLARAAAAASPEARDLALETLPPLVKKSRRRTIQNLTQAVGEEVPPNTAALQEQIRNALVTTGPVYKMLEDTVPSLPGMARFFDNDVVMRAYRNANRAYSDAGAPLQAVKRNVPGSGILDASGAPARAPSVESIPPDFRTAQLVKEALDDMVTRARGIKPKLAKPIIEVRDRYRNALYEQLDQYGTVQREYFNVLERARGIEEGLKFMNVQPNDAAQMLQDMTPDAAAGFRLGAIESMNRRLRDQARVGNVERFFNTENMDDRLEMLIKDEPTLARFLETEGVEKEIAATLNRVLGGSDTILSGRLAAMLAPSAGPAALQRAAVIPVSPGIGTARTAADIGAARLARGVQEREHEVGGQLGRTLFGAPSTKEKPAMSLLDLLTGSTGDYDPGLLNYMLARSPAALVLALQGQEERQQ